MSRKVRSSFAAPLVVTLAVAPACMVRTSSPPPGAAPTERERDRTHVHQNPPRPPTVGTTDSVNNPDPQPRDPVVVDTVQQTPPPTQSGQLASWTVFLDRRDGACYARMDVDCPPKPATCNPPPARKLDACPPNFRVDDVDRPVKIVEYAKDDCYLQAPMPACPQGASCNPPPPQKTSCPR